MRTKAKPTKLYEIRGTDRTGAAVAIRVQTDRIEKAIGKAIMRRIDWHAAVLCEDPAQQSADRQQAIALALALGL